MNDYVDESKIRTLKEYLASLNRYIKGKSFFVGDQFTAADLTFVPFLSVIEAIFGYRNYAEIRRWLNEIRKSNCTYNDKTNEAINDFKETYTLQANTEAEKAMKMAKELFASTRNEVDFANETPSFKQEVSPSVIISLQPPYWNNDNKVDFTEETPSPKQISFIKAVIARPWCASILFAVKQLNENIQKEIRILFPDMTEDTKFLTENLHQVAEIPVLHHGSLKVEGSIPIMMYLFSINDEVKVPDETYLETCATIFSMLLFGQDMYQKFAHFYFPMEMRRREGETQPLPVTSVVLHRAKEFKKDLDCLEGFLEERETNFVVGEIMTVVDGYITSILKNIKIVVMEFEKYDNITTVLKSVREKDVTGYEMIIRAGTYQFLARYKYFPFWFEVFEDK